MKLKIVLPVLLLFITFTLYAQDKESIAENDFNPHLKIYQRKPDDSGCISGLVNIRQRDKSGTILLIASAKVYFDSCGNIKKTNLCTACMDTKIKKDLFLYNKANFKKCLVDCLKKDKVLLASYYLEKEKLLASLKKK
jgi:hypothetical protein